MNELTNGVKYLLNSMYTQYLDRREDNISRRETKSFRNIDLIKENTMPEWSKEDVPNTCFELQRRRCISAMSDDNTLFFIHLATEAIVTLELEFKEPTPKEGIESILDFTAKIRAAIPFSQLYQLTLQLLSF